MTKIAELCPDSATERRAENSNRFYTVIMQTVLSDPADWLPPCLVQISTCIPRLHCPDLFDRVYGSAFRISPLNLSIALAFVSCQSTCGAGYPSFSNSALSRR